MLQLFSLQSNSVTSTRKLHISRNNLLHQLQGQTESDIKGHNLVYLHVNYNTFRLAFWVLSYMLENPKGLAALKDEIDQMIESKKDEDTGVSTLTIADIESMKILSKY